MIVKASYITHFGNHRKTNEDAVLLQDLLVKGVSMPTPGYKVLEQDGIVFCVADGMGGHVNGELASESILSYIRQNVSNLSNRKSIQKIIYESRLLLNQVAIQNDAYGLGTTLSGAYLKGNKAIIFNCGDSRVYRVQNLYLEKLTNDHSLVQALYNSGTISEEQMRTHPNKNILTSALIGDLSDQIPEIFFKEITLKVGTQLLLCTDGLWESLTADELIQCMSEKKSIEEISIILMEAALKRGGKDNISFILLQVVDL
jgi:protein phosphatase